MNSTTAAAKNPYARGVLIFLVILQTILGVILVALTWGFTIDQNFRSHAVKTTAEVLDFRERVHDPIGGGIPDRYINYRFRIGDISYGPYWSSTATADDWESAHRNKSIDVLYLPTNPKKNSLVAKGAHPVAMFTVAFGLVGAGLVVLLVATRMVIRENKKREEIITAEGRAHTPAIVHTPAVTPSVTNTTSPPPISAARSFLATVVAIFCGFLVCGLAAFLIGLAVAPKPGDTGFSPSELKFLPWLLFLIVYPVVKGAVKKALTKRNPPNQ